MNTPTNPAGTAPTTAPGIWRAGWRTLAAGVAVLAAAVTISLAVIDARLPVPSTGPGLALTLKADDGTSISSCVPFDTRYLREMPVAFAGTATSVESDQVRLRVDRWYAGGDTGSVTVFTPRETSSASLDGVAFVEGARYLVAAADDGSVNGCGFSGRHTPELERSYDTAFS